MKAKVVALALALATISTVAAQPVRWTRYTIPQTGTSVDFPSSIYTEEAGRPMGTDNDFEPQMAGPTLPFSPPQRGERFTSRLSGKKAPAFTHSVQASNPALLRNFQLQGRQGLVRSL
jgi:hypothetical protein